MTQSKNVFFLPQDAIVNENMANYPNTQDSEYTIENNEQNAGNPLSFSSLRSALTDLTQLISNVTESYTTAIFLADAENETLQLIANQSLSRDLKTSARIHNGCGLVGWTAENKVRISVCPFEHDATTLLYYNSDQGLKSFIAVPILDEQNDLLGVIACDSKKNYAFAKVSEKILMDCAKQASHLIKLYHSAKKTVENKTIDQNLLTQVISGLKDHHKEEEFFAVASNIPIELVNRDALVIITTPTDGNSKGAFYTHSKRHHSSDRQELDHRLLQIICKHKKVICPDRSVHSKSGSDGENRSFLSVPFHIAGIEVGSFNLLSRPGEAFGAAEIEALEKLAVAVGKELELIRLRERFSRSSEVVNLVSWKQFTARANDYINDMRQSNQALSLIRMRVSNLEEIEETYGCATAIDVMQRVMRLVHQVKRAPAIASYLYGSQIVLLVDYSEAKKITSRLKGLLARLSLSQTAAFYSKETELGELLLEGFEAVVVDCPKDIASFDQLLRLSLGKFGSSITELQVEQVANAASWR
jgi:transcriptional regulator with GAF, ATPase, and Fis domain